jgi:uncharacterized protein YqhQ
MTKHKIGGITTSSNITFVGKKTKIVINNKDGSYNIYKYKNPSQSKYINLPIIRGFIKFYGIFKMAFGTWIGKLSLFFLLLSLISAILGLFMDENIPTNTETSYISIFLNFIIICFIIFYTFRIRNLHGLEHKLIQTYKNNLEFNVSNIRMQRKEIPECGGTYLGLIILINYIGGLLNLSYFVIILLIPSIGYELFLLANKNKWYSKILYIPGYLTQKITTGHNISNDKISKYIPGFQRFISIDEQ